MNPGLAPACHGVPDFHNGVHQLGAQHLRQAGQGQLKRRPGTGKGENAL